MHKEILRYKNSTGPITPTDLAIILKNVNARIRYNSCTPKEILFRRSILTNNPIDIDDKKLATSQIEQREKSSKSSRKYKAKFKLKTPHQDFEIGDLVMLRDTHSKTSPREIFIVDELPADDSKFLLIRKLKDQIRSRLYRNLPEELFHSPVATDNTPPDNTHRPTRKASTVAREKIKTMVSSVKKGRSKSKTTPFKHGWNESDQEEMDEFIPIAYLHEANPIESDANSTSNSSSLAMPRPSESSSCFGTSEEEDLWDNSADQITLQASTAGNDHFPNHTSHPLQNLPPPFSRNRIPAFTRPALRRQHAFRVPPSSSNCPQSPHTLSVRVFLGLKLLVDSMRILPYDQLMTFG